MKSMPEDIVAVETEVADSFFRMVLPAIIGQRTQLIFIAEKDYGGEWLQLKHH